MNGQKQTKNSFRERKVRIKSKKNFGLKAKIGQLRNNSGMGKTGFSSVQSRRHLLLKNAKGGVHFKIRSR